MMETRTLHPRWPKLSELNPDHLLLDFDRDSDMLYLHFSGQARPSISVPLDDHYLALVDPDSENVVGIQIEGFLAHVAFALPSVLDLSVCETVFILHEHNNAQLSGLTRLEFANQAGVEHTALGR